MGKREEELKALAVKASRLLKKTLPAKITRVIRETRDENRVTYLMQGRREDIVSKIFAEKVMKQSVA